MKDSIKVTNAKVHNLKEVSLSIPKNSLTVITGPSGSGKSSLAFDTIHVEAQRRYIESLSSYARQFLGQHTPPDVESITGLSPSIAVDQKSVSKNPRSTVGTITEIYDYMRVLFARIGTLHCLKTGEAVQKYTPLRIRKDLLKHPKGRKIIIMAPVERGQGTGHLKRFFKKHQSLGLSRYRIDGEINLHESLYFLKNLKSNSKIEIVIDRLISKDNIEERLASAIDTALKIGEGSLMALVGQEEYFFSEKNMALGSREVYPDLEPRLFSFNSPVGSCPQCNGLGQEKSFDIHKLVPSQDLSIKDGAIASVGSDGLLSNMIENIASQENINIALPFKKLPKTFLKTIFYGSTKIYHFSWKSETGASRHEFSKSFPGIIPSLEERYRKTTSEKIRSALESYMEIATCSVCDGARLNAIALSTRIHNKSILDFCRAPISEALHLMKTLKLTKQQKLIGEKIVSEIILRLKFLSGVGLDYLSLERSSASLSGGEAQRIRLARQIGSNLSGILYVLDEPSIGLHQRDNLKLLKSLQDLRDLGNTVLVVEHDEETIRKGRLYCGHWARLRASWWAHCSKRNNSWDLKKKGLPNRTVPPKREDNSHPFRAPKR